jgi:hypothetical protein
VEPEGVEQGERPHQREERHQQRTHRRHQPCPPTTRPEARELHLRSGPKLLDRDSNSFIIGPRGRPAQRLGRLDPSPHQRIR